MCMECLGAVQFISEPFCDACGFPFEYDVGKNALCGACLEERPPFAHARAAFRYDDASRHLVIRLKYNDQIQLAKIYAAWMAASGQELLKVSYYIIPVPLHYFRFISRRFNQSALLAQALSKKSGVKFLPSAIKRTLHTKQQTGLSKNQREQNVRGAFLVVPKYKEIIKGKNILLIDDVYTTGSTIKHCTKALLRAGAAQVNVLTLARAGR